MYRKRRKADFEQLLFQAYSWHSAVWEANLNRPINATVNASKYGSTHDMVGQFVQWLGNLLGTTIMIVVMTIFVLSIPFSMVTIIRWFEVEWWLAILIIIGISIIPAFGQIALAVLTLFGAYYFATNEFSFPKATSTLPEARQSATIGSFQSEFIERCNDNRGQFQIPSSWSDQHFDSYCRCYADLYIKSVTIEDIEYMERNRQVSPKLQELADNSIQLCDPIK